MKERTQGFIDAFFERHNDLLPLKEQILEACKTLITAFEGANKLLLCGNGGSCADCDHIAGEFLKGFLLKRPANAQFKNTMAEKYGDCGADIAGKLQQGLPTISLVTHSAAISAFENDEIFDLTKLPSAKIIHNKTEVEIEFGGIFPFNTVIIEGEKLPYFEVFAFNGSQYESVYFGVDSSEHEVCQFKLIEGSYKIKIVSYDCDGFNENAKISVFKR